MVVILDSKIQSAEEFNKYVIHTLIQKSWHHNHPQANLKLKSTYKKVAGYVYYLKHKLKLSEYHTTLTVDEKFAEKPVLIDILSQCSMRPLPKNNSALWELVTFDKPLETDSIKQGMFTYVVIFRFHHALADGISIANSLARNLTNETSAIEGHTSKLIGTMSQRKINLENSGILSTINNVLKFIYVIAVSASVNLEERRRFKYETNCLHGPELSGQKYLVCASEQSEEQLVQNVKKMKKGIPGSTFSAILLTAVSRAIGKHFGTHCQHTPSSIVVVLPVPIAIPDGKEKVKLGNNLSYKIFDLPVLSAQTTVQKQVDAVVHGMQDVYNKTDIMVKYFLSNGFVGNLPIPMMGRTFVSARKATICFSSIPGFSFDMLCNQKLRKVYSFSPNFQNIGLTLNVFTQSDKLSFNLTVDRTLIPLKEVAQDLVNNVAEEIRLMYDEFRSISNEV
ncbi:unnamed protein product [Callosobruchus maculatus]|nr:unnamed protein product [Callosobruchus maculatus]